MLEKDTFARYEACGNDYIVLVPQALSFPLTPGAARILCDRHFGVGGDGVLAPAESSEADYGLRVINPDGGEAEFSGNGVRIFARFARDMLGEERERFSIETPSGVTRVAVPAARGGVSWVEAALGPTPHFDLTTARRVLRLEDGTEIIGYAVSTGNPHFVVFEADACGTDISSLGPALQRHDAFAQGVNVELVAPGDAGGQIDLRIWERGVGETLSSGSCACAAVLVSRALGLVGPGARVRMPGGVLAVDVGPDSSLSLRGPIREIMRGRFGSDLVDRIVRPG